MDLLHPAPAVPQAVLLSEPLDTPKVIPFGKTVKASNPLSVPQTNLAKGGNPTFMLS